MLIQLDLREVIKKPINASKGLRSATRSSMCSNPFLHHMWSYLTCTCGFVKRKKSRTRRPAAARGPSSKVLLRAQNKTSVTSWQVNQFDAKRHGRRNNYTRCLRQGHKVKNCSKAKNGSEDLPEWPRGRGPVRQCPLAVRKDFGRRAERQIEKGFQDSIQGMSRSSLPQWIGDCVFTKRLRGTTFGDLQTLR